MNKTAVVLGGIIILIIFISLSSWADPCLGDFDCDGDVDGYNLSQFSANFGMKIIFRFQISILACCFQNHPPVGLSLMQSLIQ